MQIKRYLQQFWRCTDMTYTGVDAFVCEAGHYREKLVNDHTFLSGLHLDYDFDEPGMPAYIVFDKWDLSEDELCPDYYATGHVQKFKSIRNGFVVLTGNDEQGSTTYTFKKVRFNPLKEQMILRERVAEQENAVIDQLAPEPDVDYTIAPWAKLMLRQAQGKKDYRFADFNTLFDLKAYEREQRKELFNTDTSILEVLNEGQPNPDEKLLRWFCNTLAQYINAFLISRHIEGQEEFCEKFTYFSVKQLASGEVGNESFDDIVCMADAFIADREVYRIVAEKNLSEEDYAKLCEWLDGVKAVPNWFSECVLGGVCAILGVIPAPSIEDEDPDEENVDCYEEE